MKKNCGLKSPAFAAIILICSLLSNSVNSAPCAPGGLSGFLGSGFSCTIADGTWTFFDFNFNSVSVSGNPPPTAENITVNPFGGFQRAGLEFGLNDPFNTVVVDDFYAFSVDFTVQSTRDILSASRSTVNAVTGPTPGAARSLLTIRHDLCLGALIIAGNCPATESRLFFESRGGETLQDINLVDFTQPSLKLIDVEQVLQFAGGGSLPGGARLDSWAIRFNTVPEPGTLALFGVGLAGLGFVRRRRRLTRH